MEVLHALESSRHGATIDALARELEVTTRTIRRDLAALQEAGFAAVRRARRGRPRAVADRRSGAQGTRDRVHARRALRAVSESSICSSRWPARRFNAISRTRSPVSRRCCLRACGSSSIGCPRSWRPSLARALAAAKSSADIVARLLEATLHFRVTTMRYHSVSSARIKDYVVHPYRLAFAQGGLYLLAYVPEYSDVRTFAVRPDRLGVSREADLHAEAADRRRRLRQLARREHRACRARGDRVRRPRGAVRPRPGLARLAADRATRRGRPPSVDGRLPRLGAAQLDPQLGRLRAGRVAGGACGRDQIRSSIGCCPIHASVAATAPYAHDIDLAASLSSSSSFCSSWPGRRSSASTRTGSGSAKSATSTST